MGEDIFDWTEYASNPDDGATIINLIKENESLKSELEQLKKENLAMRNVVNCTYGFFNIDGCLDCKVEKVKSCSDCDKWEIKG